MEVQVQADVITFYSKLNEFRDERKYCDVTVQVDGEYFSCHRNVLASACEYFDKMFGTTFQESHTNKVILKDVDAKIFEEILHFMYTGRITITDENNQPLLTVSEYLGLHYIEDLCIAYIKENIPILNTLEIFSFAVNTNKSRLIDALSRYIAENYSILCLNDGFLDLSYQALKMIFDRADFHLESDDLLLDSIIRWVKHEHQERNGHLSELLKGVNVEKLSATYMKLLIRLLVNHDISSYEIYEDESEDLPKIRKLANIPSVKLIKNLSPLNVYILSKRKAGDKLVAYGVNKKYQWSCIYHIDFKAGRKINCKTVPYANRLHFFFCSENNLMTHDFSISTKMIGTRTGLEAPPIVPIQNFDLSVVQNRIYFYAHEMKNTCIFNKSSDGSTRYTPSISNFSKSELDRGICAYYCEMNRWFPVPQTKLSVKSASLVSCNNVLYILGGYCTSSGSYEKGYAQCYDYRLPEWHEVHDMSYQHINASSCTHNGKIYISGGSFNSHICEEYDPIAGKWRTTAPMNNARMKHKLISYNNRVWALGNNFDLSAEIYDPKLNKWTSITSLDKAVSEHIIDSHSFHKVSDAVVFEFVG